MKVACPGVTASLLSALLKRGADGSTVADPTVQFATPTVHLNPTTIALKIIGTNGPLMSSYSTTVL